MSIFFKHGIRQRNMHSKMFYVPRDGRERVCLAGLSLVTLFCVYQLLCFVVVTTQSLRQIDSEEAVWEQQSGWTRVVWLSHHLCASNTSNFVNIHCDSVLRQSSSRAALSNQHEEIVGGVLSSTRNTSLLFRGSLVQITSATALQTAHSLFHSAMPLLGIWLTCILSTAVLLAPLVAYNYRLRLAEKGRLQHTNHFDKSMEDMFHVPTHETHNTSGTGVGEVSSTMELQAKFDQHSEYLRKRFQASRNSFSASSSLSTSSSSSTFQPNPTNWPDIDFDHQTTGGGGGTFTPRPFPSPSMHGRMPLGGSSREGFRL